MAGYMGCASVDKVPVSIRAKNPPADLVFQSTNIINGLNDVSVVNDYNAKEKTDVLIIRRASDDGVSLTGNLDPNNANIKIADNLAGFQDGDFLFISDCVSADLFCANSVSKANNDVTISHPASCNNDAKLSKVYGSDAQVLAFRSTAYFIRDTGRDTVAGSPILALYIQSRNMGQGGAALTAYELVEGVENMQLEYGLDTGADGIPDEYRTANNISADEWAHVVTVKLSLLMQSIDEKLVNTSGAMVQDWKFNGTAVDKDGRLREAFSTVIAIRNRLP